jgi:hypothetical protein
LGSLEWKSTSGVRVAPELPVCRMGGQYHKKEGGVGKVEGRRKDTEGHGRSWGGKTRDTHDETRGSDFGRDEPAELAAERRGVHRGRTHLHASIEDASLN